MQKLNPAVVVVLIMFAVISSLAIAVKVTQIEKKQKLEQQILAEANEQTQSATDQVNTTPPSIDDVYSVVPEPLTAQDPITEPTQEPENIYYTDSYTWPLKILNFEANNFSEDRGYPELLKNIPVKDYQKIACTPIYSINLTYLTKPNSNTPVLFENGDQPVKDEKLISLINKRIKENENDTSFFSEYIQRCEVNGKDIVMYNRPSGGGGGGNKTYVGYLNESEVAIPNAQPYGGAYFGCGEPILFTKDERIYLECGSGDGGASSSAILEVDLKNKKYKSVLACQYSYNSETDQVDSKCFE